MAFFPISTSTSFAPIINDCLQWAGLIRITFPKLLLLEGITVVNYCSSWLSQTGCRAKSVCVTDSAFISPTPAHLKEPDNLLGFKRGSWAKAPSLVLGMLCGFWPWRPVACPSMETGSFVKGKKLSRVIYSLACSGRSNAFSCFTLILGIHHSTGCKLMSSDIIPTDGKCS